MSPWLILIPLGVFGGFIAFVWHRLAIAPGWRPRWVRYAVAAALVVLTAFAFAGFDVWGGSFTPAQMRPVAWLGQAFLASCLYLFLGLVPVWLASVAIWLLRWRHDDHGRSARRRLNAIASPLVAAVAVGVTAYGAVEAATPSVSRFELASPQLPAEFDGARVALVTDVHGGAVRGAAFTPQVVGLVNEQGTDLIVRAGARVRGKAAGCAPELAPRAALRAPLGVFATTGNHEMFEDTVNWVSAFEDVGLVVLGNESVPLERGGATMVLAGAAAPAAPPGPRRRWRRSRPPGLRAHPRRSVVADQLPRAPSAADARGPRRRRRHSRHHLAWCRGLGAGDPGGCSPGGPDHHPEAVVSGCRA